MDYKNNLSKNETFSIIMSIEDTTDRKLTFSPSEHYFLAIGNTGANITVEIDGQTYDTMGAVLISAKNGFSIKCQSKQFISFLISSSCASQLGAYLETDIFEKPLTFAANLSVADKKGIIEKIGKISGSNIIEVKAVLFEIISNYFLNIHPFTKFEEKNIPQWLFELTEQIKQNKNFVKGVPFMTELSQKSPEHLARSMKKYYGITPTEFINSLRMKNASQLLIQTDQSVMDICFENGYQNISWFNTLFKETFGVSPGEYRLLFRNK